MSRLVEAVPAELGVEVVEARQLEVRDADRHARSMPGGRPSVGRTAGAVLRPLASVPSPRAGVSSRHASRVAVAPARLRNFVARRPIGAGQDLTFDYAVRNFTIDQFPAVCRCGAARCRGSVTGWKDLPAARTADYGDLVAPYLRVMDDEIRHSCTGRAGSGAKSNDWCLSPFVGSGGVGERGRARGRLRRS